MPAMVPAITPDTPVLTVTTDKRMPADQDGPDTADTPNGSALILEMCCSQPLSAGRVTGQGVSADGR